MTAANLATEIVSLCREHEFTLAVAESLTGGALTAQIVDVPGASTVLRGGIVSYHTELKHSLLGVATTLLGEYGPVHPRVAEEMALGARNACATHRDGDAHPVHPDFGVATTGVAGPDPDAETGQLPGTVWVAVSSHLGERSRGFQFEGDRSAVREQAVFAALDLLRDEIYRSIGASD